MKKLTVLFIVCAASLTICATRGSSQVAMRNLAPQKMVGTARAVYFRKRNQITVQVQALQLYGDLDNGVIMIPSYITQGKRVSEPKWVDLEFVSYSERGAMFTRNRKLLFKAGDQIVYAGSLRLVFSRRTDKSSFTEIMSHRMPYARFLQIANSEQVEIEIGDADCELTEAHLQSLRDLERITNAGLRFP